ncbi:MAG: molybdopterin converting factor subunit 1 [Pseudomonadota bacterium]
MSNTAKIQVLYFARLREALHLGSEDLELPAADTTVADLTRLLAQRGEPWKSTLHDTRVITAVNQEVAIPETPIKDGDEVAFFPPVTGG